METSNGQTKAENGFNNASNLHYKNNNANKVFGPSQKIVLNGKYGPSPNVSNGCASTTSEAIVRGVKIAEPHLHSLYQVNGGVYHRTKVCPVPSCDGMPVPKPGDWEEPKFDEDIHLNLGSNDRLQFMLVFF